MCDKNRNYFIITVDVDSWSSLLNFYSVKHDPIKVNLQVSVREGILKLLQLFAKHNIRATFFVPAELARTESLMIRKAKSAGHEIACHGLIHGKNECLTSEGKQRQTIEKATGIIEEEIGVKPCGFRAPCLRANETTLRILEELGYLYDSSVVPTFIPRYYGLITAPMRPYHPSPFLINKEGSLSILEIPVSVNPLFPLPLSAGWIRNLGLPWVKFGVKMNFLFGNPVVIYVHPRDVVALPKIKGVPWHLYVNTGFSTLRMLDKVITYSKKERAVFKRAEDLAERFLRSKIKEKDGNC